MQTLILEKDIKANDKINGHEKGWLTVKTMKRSRHTHYQNVTLMFTDGTERTYSEDERVEAVRI